MDDLNKISRGEVFYIKSFSDTVGSEQKSGRPAVVVSNNTCNNFSPCVEICYLTLQEKTKLPTHVLVDRGACVNSTILCEQVTTISKQRVGDYMCTLPDDIMDAVDKAIVISLGLEYIIEQESRKSVTPTKNLNGISSEDLKNMRDEITALKEHNKELIKARDSATKKAEGAEILKQEAKLYKKMYDNLLNKILEK